MLKMANFLLIIFSMSAAAQQRDNLTISPLTGDFYVYTTYNEYRGTRIGANGMYLVTDEGVVLFDTPWDTTQFQPLLDSIKVRHNKNVVLAFATHFHDDRTGGLEYYTQQGVATYTTAYTDALSMKRGMKRAAHLMVNDTTFTVGQYSFATYYPGHGHAPDNIVIWFEKEKILYGGCLVKSTADTTLGNLGDASTTAYANTIRNVQRKCRDPKYIITGHNDYSSTRSLKHTYKMAKALQKR
jgi:metallo-beta-lactamase class B